MERLAERITRRFQEVRLLGRAFARTDIPILAQIVPTRRCNLACAYCNEYDQVSKPVATELMLRRLDRLHELGTCIVTFSGGEPMMHPDLDALIARVREHGMLAGLITNGFYLGKERIERLNAAGLQYLQISIDNVEPDEISNKSLKTLDKKLEHLRDHANFHININSVVGAGMKRPDDAITIARRASELGFSTSVGILHDTHGQLEALSSAEKDVYEQCVRLGEGHYTRINDFQRNLIDGKPNDWQCRAGARYLYICEDGLVHYCSQQRGTPAIPLEVYGKAQIRYEQTHQKSCAPLCTIGCVHRASSLDNITARLVPLRRLA